MATAYQPQKEAQTLHLIPNEVLLIETNSGVIVRINVWTNGIEVKTRGLDSFGGGESGSVHFIGHGSVDGG